MTTHEHQPVFDQFHPRAPGQPLHSSPAAPGSGSLDQEKLLAIGSYASIFLGLPIFVIPLAMRESELALYHAKQATVVFCMQLLLAFVFTFVMLITFGLGFIFMPLIFLPWIPAIHGMILAARGEMREPMMLFGIADSVFGSYGVNR